jgi:hypothetical protein
MATRQNDFIRWSDEASSSFARLEGCEEIDRGANTNASRHEALPTPCGLTATAIAGRA